MLSRARTTRVSLLRRLGRWAVRALGVVLIVVLGIGGYFFIQAANMDEATAIAEESPNLKYGMTVEVRPIAGGCHLARSLGLKGMREPAEASSASSSNSAG